MSKVSLDIDTETGEVNLSVDGETFDNVNSVNIYCYRYNDFNQQPKKEVEVSVELTPESLGDGFRKFVRLVTANSSYARKNNNKQIKSIGDLLLFEDETEKSLSESAKVLLGRKS